MRFGQAVVGRNGREMRTPGRRRRRALQTGGPSAESRPVSRAIPVIIVSLSAWCLADSPASTAPSPATAPAADAAGKTQPTWNRVATHEFAIAVPAGWENKPRAGAMMVLHVGTDAADESGQPLRFGLTVERSPHGGPAEDGHAAAEAYAAELLRRFREDASFKLVGDPTIEPVRLAEGRDGSLLRLEAYRGADRRTAIAKLVVVRGNLRWVASAYATAGRESRLAGLDGPTLARLLAHLRTFTTDPARFDPAPVDLLTPDAGK